MQDLVINFSKDESDFKYKSEFVLDGLWSILEFIEFFILKKGQFVKFYKCKFILTNCDVGFKSYEKFVEHLLRHAVNPTKC